MRLGVHRVTARELGGLGRASAAPRSRARPVAATSLCRSSTSSSCRSYRSAQSVSSVRAAIELHAEPHALADEMRRPLEDRIDVQLAGDFRQRQCRALVAHRRRARDHAQGLDARKIRNHRLGHAVGEVFLVGILRDVAKRQHGDSADRGPRRAGGRGSLPKARTSAARFRDRRRPMRDGARCPSRGRTRQTRSKSAGASGRSDRTDGAGVLTIANISACGRSCGNGRVPVGQFEQRDAKRVDVGARVVRLARAVARAPCRRASP